MINKILDNFLMPHKQSNGKYSYNMVKNILLKWDEFKSTKNWHTGTPEEEVSVICRMRSGYIKLCHWTGDEWLDMWSSELEGEVIEWMYVPYDKK